MDTASGNGNTTLTFMTATFSGSAIGSMFQRGRDALIPDLETALAIYAGTFHRWPPQDSAKIQHRLEVIPRRLRR
jgi:hypothetical protein